ncbi:acyltransferase family protein [Diaphorobacter sp.]|uniref:acyltransferase family protein n=1 Tax=Diaphorobacter sp. TaxID=1934310 RepID=UPI00258D0CB2|nr:acyltransferase family protein [Diaphorobacter sp.]
MTLTTRSSALTDLGNNFDAIRIVAATMVLISHHYALTGQAEPSFFGIHSLGGLAVTIFFAISGYLVAGSWCRDPDVWRFGLRRFLRIWPALTVAIAITAYGLGAWATELPLSEYLAHGATSDYLRGLWMHIHFVLPGVFEHNPAPHVVNGSLWTIPIEVRCYIVLGLAGLIGLLRRRTIFLLCIAIYMVWFMARSNPDLTGITHYGRELSAFFLAGTALYMLEPSWQRRPILWSIGIASATVIAWTLGWRHTALLIGLPFSVVYLGTRATPLIRNAGRWGDPSYGIYLFAFPVQQAIISNTWPSLNFMETLALSLVATVTLAYLSWHGIEKQALKLKPNMQHTDVEETPMPPYFWPAAMLILVALGAGLRFFDIGGFSFWDDELFSIASVTRSGPWNGPLLPDRSMAHLQISDSFWTWKLADPHPPLYEMLLVPWISLVGISEFAVRSLSALFGILTLLSAFALPYSITKATRIIYVFLLAVSGALLIYSQEARSYALCACISAWMLAIYLRQSEERALELENGKPSVPLLVLGGLLAITHYYGLVFALSIAAFSALQVRSLLAFARLSLRWFLAFLPVAIYMGFGLVGILTKLNAAPPAPLSFAMTFKRNVIAFIRNFFPGDIQTPHFWFFILITLGAIFIYYRMRTNAHPLRSTAGRLIGILVLFFVVQVIGTRRAEFMHERYMIFIIPGCLLLAALYTQVKGWPRLASGLLILFLIPTGLMVWQKSPQPQGWGDWRGASALVAKLYQPGDVILVPIGQPVMLSYFQHYLMKSIPLEELEKKMWSGAHPEELVERLLALPQIPYHLIIFNHGSLSAQTEALSNALKTELGCTTGTLQSIQNLRVIEVNCRNK